jgi:transcription initiation factor TFIIIB Brf1 subunit/transcription initiation factor TFIIB
MTVVPFDNNMTVNETVCTECGGVVHAFMTDKHEEWHKKIDALLDELESK